MNQPLPERQQSRLEVTLSGPVATSVLDLLDERYDDVTTSGADGASTVLTFGNLDSAAERAVLTLLWDTGHQVRSVWRRDS